MEARSVELHEPPMVGYPINHDRGRLSLLKVSPPSRNSPCLIISSLDATVGRVLDMIVKMSNGDEEQKKAQRETMEQFRELINADTLRTMQLLGFNYKACNR